ncbi:MAG: nucleotidyltransferase [Candidatus Ornithomonoglobus sp.]
MAIGIIAEFNPFHNGHKYLISEAKRLNNNEPVICIMSGAFVQRGEPAVTDKWTRAKMALENGADLIFELPVTFSLNTAQKFAYGAVSTLHASGIVDTLAFGSESGNSQELDKAAALFENEPPEVSQMLKELMAEGMSYPAARARAYEGFISPSLLSSPNDILGIEYLRAAKTLNSAFNICAVARRGTGHDSAETTDEFASASKLRRIILENGSIAGFVPYGGSFPVYVSGRLETAVIARLRTCGADYIRQINDVAEGLENKFIKAAVSSCTVNEVCNAVKSKRYTMSRIRRIIWSAFLGITKDKAALPPSYIRVLGMNKTGMSLLKQMKTTARLPAVVKAADYPGDMIFDANRQAEDIFSLAATDPGLRSGGRDLTTPPVII